MPSVKKAKKSDTTAYKIQITGKGEVASFLIKNQDYDFTLSKSRELFKLLKNPISVQIFDIKDGIYVEVFKHVLK